MKVELIDSKKNDVMEREEVLFKVYHDGKSQPSRKEMTDVVEAQLGKKSDFFVIKKIESLFGSSISKVRVNVYSSKDKKEYFESSSILKKNTFEVPKSAEQSANA